MSFAVLWKMRPRSCAQLKRFVSCISFNPVGQRVFSVPPSRTMKIYTKTGDKGKTSLYCGERAEKTDLRFDALGSIDELSSWLGLCRVRALTDEALFDEAIIHVLHDVQCRLQDMGSIVATLPPKTVSCSITENEITTLESSIDKMTSELPSLTQFIIPGGSLLSAHLHVARTVCRRAERSCLRIEPKIDMHALKYLNRLSDYLFTAARFASFKLGQNDDIYSPKV